MDQDRKFLDTFLIVIGALLMFTVAMYYLANALADSTLDTDNSENPLAVAAASERIEPVAKVRTSNDPAPAVVKTAAAAEKKAMSGEEVFNQACTTCHGAGIAGAPKVGDKAAWAARIAQGEDILLEHALNGFQGNSGYMPAKGGRTDLSDEEVKAAIEYMVERSK